MEPTVRDSAGVRIVGNTRPAWSDADGWRVNEEPSLTIGAVEGDSALLFSRITGAVRLSDGRIVVADGGSSQLRHFDAAGQFIEAVGGSGEGPGEFQFLGRLWRRPGDTLAVIDVRPRVSYFDRHSRFIRAEPIAAPADARQAFVVGQADDGTHLAWSGTRGYAGAVPNQVFQDTIRLWRIAADASGSRLLGGIPAQERWILQAGGATTYPFLAFSSPHSVAAGPDRFVAGGGRSGEVSVWSPDGTLAALVRWPAERRPVTPAVLERFREERLASTPDANERRRLEQFLADAPTAAELPAYQSLLVDDERHLWVEEYRPAWESTPTWQLFAADGRWLGRVRTPDRLRIFQIGDDFVLGRWLDEQDVEHVRLYALVKPR